MIVMKAYWQQLNEREQLAVVAASIFVIAYLFYALIYAPLTSAVTNEQAQWRTKQATLVWMRHVEQTYSQDKRPQTVAEGNLLSILTQVLKGASFHRFPYQLAQTAGGEIQLSFDAVPYNAFITWLQAQTVRYTLTIKNIDMTKTDVPGVVKASVIFGVE